MATSTLVFGLLGGSLAAQDEDKAAKAVEDILAGAADDGPALLTPPSARASDAEAVKVVDRYIEAIGGLDTLAAITDRTTKFRNTKFSATGETKAFLSLYLKSGYLYREDWLIEGFKIGDRDLAFTQIYNGEVGEGWVKMFDTISPLEGRTLGVFVWDKHLDDFFVHWKDDGYTLAVDGKGIVDEAPATIVKVTDFGGRNAVRYFFSNESGLLVKKEWIDLTQREPANKEQYYRDYRKIAFSDGSGKSILFALQLDILVDGDLDTERVFTEVKFNSGLDAAIFAQPEGTPFDQRKPFDGQDALDKLEGIDALEGFHTGGGRRSPGVRKPTTGETPPEGN